MTFENWESAYAALCAATGPATAGQHRTATHAGIEIAPETPRTVAAALLRNALYVVLETPRPRTLSARFAERLDDMKGFGEPTQVPATDAEAEAWIRHLYLVRRRDALAELKVVSGDVVVTRDGSHAIVSSIDDEGRVYFKGGLGYASWPDLLTVAARVNDVSATANDARNRAKNAAAARTPARSWSIARAVDLAEFRQDHGPTGSDIDYLERIVCEATDERPIQQFLQQRLHVLAGLLGGHDRYCIPLQRFGSKYVADFVLASTNSLGVRWLLVELETPRTSICLSDGKTLSKEVRKGVDQIKDWRHWIESNLATARARRSEDGLGLYDITRSAAGLVIVGRRATIGGDVHIRRSEHHDAEHIEIHTYDWLLETLRGAVSFAGPDGINPHLLLKGAESILSEDPF